MWLFFVWLLCGLVSCSIASNKGRSGCLWLGIGFVFGPLGLIAAAVIPPDSDAIEQRQLDSGERALCPACRETIHPEATICPHCRSEVPR